MITASSLAIFVLFVGTKLSQNIVEQVATLFDQYNGEGSKIIGSQRYLYNLLSENFDDRAHSVCVTGIWILYEHSLFNSQGKGKVESIFGRDNYCVNLRTIAGKVSSVRFAGNPMDYKIDSLTIYEHTNFEGQEENTYEELQNLDNLSENHQSIIVTGDSNWAVFDQPMYQGKEVCLDVPQAGKYTPSFVSDFQGSTNAVNYGSIRSAKKGCANAAAMNLTLQLFLNVISF